MQLAQKSKVNIFKKLKKKNERKKLALAGVAQWIERRPADQSVLV